MRSALLPAVAALALAGGGPLPSFGFGRSRGNKYLGTPPGARESARIAHRERVNEAAREWQGDPCNIPWTMPSVLLRFYRVPRCRRVLPSIGYQRARMRAGFGYAPALDALDAALSAPRPCRSPRKPTPRRRYSRAHRRGCARCRDVTREPDLYEDNGSGIVRITFAEARYIAPHLAQDPHGSRA